MSRDPAPQGKEPDHQDPKQVEKDLNAEKVTADRHGAPYKDKPKKK